jgi:hypothetical protein
MNGSRYVMRGALAVLVSLTCEAAIAETSCTIPTNDEVQARTAKCLLSIDGRLLVNERCKFKVSPEGHATILDAGKHYVEVNVIAKDKGTVAMAFWNRGSGRSNQLLSLGAVTYFERSGAYCFRNQRIETCASDFLTCKCGPNDGGYGCKPDD